MPRHSSRHFAHAPSIPTSWTSHIQSMPNGIYEVALNRSGPWRWRLRIVRAHGRVEEKRRAPIAMAEELGETWHETRREMVWFSASPQRESYEKDSDARRRGLRKMTKRSALARRRPGLSFAACSLVFALGHGHPLGFLTPITRFTCFHLKRALSPVVKS